MQSIQGLFLFDYSSRGKQSSEAHVIEGFGERDHGHLPLAAPLAIGMQASGFSFIPERQ
jgi:hypothetical protein